MNERYKCNMLWIIFFTSLLSFYGQVTLNLILNYKQLLEKLKWIGSGTNIVISNSNVHEILYKRKGTV